MDRPQGGDITQVLGELRAGDPGAMDRLYPMIYAELRRSAASLLRRERDANTVQATELVHDALLRVLLLEPLHRQFQRALRCIVHRPII